MNKMVTSLLVEQYNWTKPKMQPLRGYAIKNTLVENQSEKLILKEYDLKDASIELLKEESRVIYELNQKHPQLFPKPIKNKSGEYVLSIHSKGYKVFSYMEGSFFAEENHTDKLINSFGNVLAKMDLELLKLNSNTIQAQKLDWDIQHLNTFDFRSKYIKDPNKRKWSDYFALQFKEQVLPNTSKLRKSIIHGDANDWNILVSNEKINGIIDFGDMCYAPLINELAIALTYIMFNKEEPINAACIMIKSYSEVLPLEKDEIELLYYLIGARLCISIRNSSYYSSMHPTNEYISVSEENICNLMEKWISINPIGATNQFLKAAGHQVEDKYDIDKDLEIRFNHISKSLSVSYSKPIKMEKAAFQYMFDNRGVTYLDMCNNIPHVGHCHPYVVEAGQRQMAKLNTNTRYVYDSLHNYSERLLGKLPEQLSKIFFVNSGSAANDLALRLSRAHTKKFDLMILEHGYHGNTATGIEISSYKFEGKGGTGQAQHVCKAPMPDLLRGKYKLQDAGNHYAMDAIQQFKSHGPIAAFIAEPIIGCGGQVVLPKGYLPKIYKAIREQGGVCISDEVQTGFGRMGSVFWGYELHDVIPDIVVIGKPMGNGHPMGAVVTTDKIAKSFETGMEFFSSFGGNPVSCEIGNAVIDVIENEELQENACKTGNYLKGKLNKLKLKYPIIADIRGEGLFLGIELAERITLNPHTEKAKSIKEQLKSKGVLIGTDGPHENVIKIKPPLCFDKSNANTFLFIFEEILKDII